MESTGIGFVDRLLGGGHEPGRTYGLLGPIGVGKSTLIAMICVEGAFRLHSEVREARRRRVWVLFNVDGSMADADTRILSHGARISRSQRPDLRMMIQTLSTGDWYHEYEIKRKDDLPSVNGVIVPEVQRVTQARRILSQHLVVGDFGRTWFDSAPTPCQVLVGHLDQLTKTGAEVAGVAIDYAGAAVVRSLNRKGELDQWTLPLGIENFTHECRERIADRFGCVVWVVHQLTGDVGQQPSGYLPHHTEAAHTRRFGESLDGCLVLGVRDQQSHCFLLTCTKSAKATTLPAPVILGIDPDFATLRERPDALIDRSSRRIVTPTTNAIDVAPDVWRRVLASSRRQHSE